MIGVARHLMAAGIRVWVGPHTVNIVETGIVKQRLKKSDTAINGRITEVIPVVAMEALQTLAVK